VHPAQQLLAERINDVFLSERPFLRFGQRLAQEQEGLLFIQTTGEQSVVDLCQGLLNLQLAEIVLGRDEHGEQALDLSDIIVDFRCRWAICWAWGGSVRLGFDGGHDFHVGLSRGNRDALILEDNGVGTQLFLDQLQGFVDGGGFKGSNLHGVTQSCRVI